MPKMKHILIALILTLIFSPFSALADLTATFFDVGQGDSALIQADGKTMLIDAGPEESADLLISYIDNAGVKKIDILVGTHPHADHIGGMLYVIGSYDIGSIWMPKAQSDTQTFEYLLLGIQNRDMKITAPRRGSTYKLGNAKITVLAPVSQTYDDLNNYSIVLRIDYGKTSFLFTGDAEVLSENEMLKSKSKLNVDVLKVGHHGSNTATSDAFLDRVSPAWAIISCGEDNTYGHPHDETLNKLQASGASILRIDLEGSITLISDGKTIQRKAGEAIGITAIVLPATQTPEPEPESSEEQYIGNKNTKKFHMPYCRSLPAEKNQVIFDSREEAIKKGYIPCKICNP